MTTNCYNKGMSKGSLNRRQQVFVSEYLIDFNGTRAAKAAGYSEKTAYSMASENLRKPEIRALIQDQVSKAEENYIFERQRIISELRKLSYRGDPNSYPDVSPQDSLKAIFMLGKLLGMFWEKPQIDAESEWVKKMKNALIKLQEMKEKGKI